MGRYRVGNKTDVLLDISGAGIVEKGKDLVVEIADEDVEAWKRNQALDVEKVPDSTPLSVEVAAAAEAPKAASAALSAEGGEVA